jgi:putative ABC transport system permease protein
MGVERGMDTTQVGAVELSFSSSTPRVVRLNQIEAMLEQVQHAPGIESAAAVNDLPLGGEAGTMVLIGSVDGASASPSMRRGARYLLVSPGYFRTLGIPLRKGRDFTARDDSLAAPAVIINEALARRWFPDVDPVGRRLTVLGREEPYTVVGVVADVREVGLAVDVTPQLYHPIHRITPGSFALVARGRGEPEVILATLRDAVRAVDPGQAVGRARTMDQVVRDSVAPQRTNALLISLFAALALVLAALGVYSVVANSIAQRDREFGIRTALGATHCNLVVMVSREIVVLVAIGIAIGLAGAWAGARVVEAMVYGVTVHDPATFALGPVALGFIAMSAAVLPVRRMSRVNPGDVIRRD